MSVTRDDQNIKTILVSGGAGYLGSTMVPLFLSEGYKVTVYDIFRWGTQSLLGILHHENLTVIKGDVLDTPRYKALVEKHDVIIHLAAIVGFPACKKEPEMALALNQTCVEKLVEWLRPEQRVIYASTGSCYGAVEGICYEDTKCNPTSLYGETKQGGENAVLKKANGVALRLATVFGASPRLRCDLLINDLLQLACTLKTFDVYEPHFKRTFLHVKDVARAFLFAIQHYGSMQGQAYNVGDESMNLTKMEVAKIIEDNVEGCEITEGKGTDADKRDYEVCYAKIKKLGHKTVTVTIQQGIKELLKIIPHLTKADLKIMKNV